MSDKTFILVAVSDNEPARALVDKLMDEMGGEVVDMISADMDIIEAEGMPLIKWRADFE